MLLYLDFGSRQNLYQDIHKYDVIVLMKISWSDPSDKIIPNSICIIFWSNMCMVSIKEDIIPNLPFQSAGQLLFLSIVSSNVDFGDTRSF